MRGKLPKYGPFVVLLLASLLLLGSCKALDSLKLGRKGRVEREHSRARQEAWNRYYDSLRVAERQRIQDSCNRVIREREELRLSYEPPTEEVANSIADSILDYASTFIGVPYRYGANGPTEFDCSGFTLYVFRRFGYHLKRTAAGQVSDGWRTVDDPKELRRCDLVFFKSRRDPSRIGHVGVVVSHEPDSENFTFIHATVKLGVTVSSTAEKYYRDRYVTACRILPEL